ncbi:uncharacterized protein TNCV_2808251 [Trichonephila clavipes]|nr:uncharacterized protein TNCV_2808251 [Trichonephila clavipes]
MEGWKRIFPSHACPLLDHLCWKGPSTAMESDSIVEGLLYLETVHLIRCTRLVGDGDSNIIAKCRERISYGGRILKVECANHAVRRYGRAAGKYNSFLRSRRYKRATAFETKDYETDKGGS